MPKPVYSEEYLDTGAPQYLLHLPSADRQADPAAGSAPVLLFVHGGPGFSESFLGCKLKRQWGEVASLVFWDQRGCGKSLAAGPMPPDYPITVDDIKRDMKAVVDHLKERYGVAKVVVLGHSWGSILGSFYALDHPEDVLAYIGVGVCVQYQDNERRVWEALRERIVEAGNGKDLAALPPFEDIDLLTPRGQTPPPNAKTFMRLRLKYRLAYKLRPRDVATYLLNPTFKLSDLSYRRKEVAPLAVHLVDYLWEFDLRKLGPRYQAPIAYLQGTDDWSTVTSLATEYFDTIEAPRKLLRLIPGSGHAPMVEAPAQFTAALREALQLIDP